MARIAIAMEEQTSLPSDGYDRAIEKAATRVLNRMDSDDEIDTVEYHLSEVVRELPYFGDGGCIETYSEVIESGHTVLVPTEGLLSDCTGGEECLRRIAREQAQADVRVSVLESERGTDALATG